MTKKGKKPALSGSTVADRAMAPTDPPQPMIEVTNRKKTGHVFITEKHKLAPGESAFVEGELARLLRKHKGVV